MEGIENKTLCVKMDWKEEAHDVQHICNFLIQDNIGQARKPGIYKRNNQISG
jgi:hypothetical protein